MKISISQLLAIRQRDYNVLNRAFSAGLGESYSNPDYALTQEGAKAVAAEIEKICIESEQDSELFPLTADQKMQNIRDANNAAEAFRDLVFNVFGL